MQVCAHLPSLLEACRAVVAEVNDQVPWTHGDRTFRKEDFALLVASSRPRAAPAQKPRTETENAIARNALPFIPDGATLEFGIGTLPDAVCSVLGNHKGLRVHSGTVGDGVIELNAISIDCAMLIGSKKLFAQRARAAPARHQRALDAREGLLELFCRHGLVEVKALKLVARMCSQILGLLLGFNALRNYGHA